MNQPEYCQLTEMSYSACRIGRAAFDASDAENDGGNRGRRAARRPNRVARANVRSRGEFRYARAGRPG